MAQSIFSKSSGEAESFPQDLEGRTRFPLFAKIIVVFVLFGFLPLSVVLVLFLNNLAGDIQIQTIFFILFFITAISIGIFLSVRIVIRPLKKLLNGVRQLARGEYGAKIEIKSNDEFSIFADYFNEMSQKLKITIEREKAISQMKSEFITLAAHQLRTPLSAIKWVMKMMINGDVGKLTQEQKDFLQKGYDSNERIIGLVNDMLDVAKIEEGRFGYNFEFGDIVAVIKETLNEQVLRFQEKNIKVIFEPPEKDFPKIKMDSQKIKLALKNILENSINYTLAGGQIQINTEPSGRDYLEIKIQDTGAGIPHSQMPRLFSKFFRSENVIKMQTEGSGLGLFIVKNIIKRHGGEIWIESEEGKGTTVHFTLPFKERLIPEKEEALEEFITGF